MSRGGSRRSPLIVWATANIGRATHVGPVESSLRKIRDVLLSLGLPIVLFLQEIDEGDRTKPDDHTLLRRIFRWRKGWRKAHMRGRDPILFHGTKRDVGRWIRAAAGLARQTPPRQIAEARVPTPGDQPDIETIGGHYPAGSRNGRRPPHVKAELDERYDRMLDLHRERIRYHHDKGRHVVTGIDGNDRSFAELHPDQVVLSEHGPDILIAIPAPGWRFAMGDAGAIQLDVEPLHDCLYRAGYFEEIPR